MEPIQSFLKRCKLARKQSYKNLTMFPVLAPNLTTPGYLILEQALDQNLVRIFKTLQRRSMCVCELQEALKIVQSSISKHLKILDEAGLVNNKNETFRVNYYLTDERKSPFASSII